MVSAKLCIRLEFSNSRKIQALESEKYDKHGCCAFKLGPKTRYRYGTIFCIMSCSSGILNKILDDHARLLHVTAMHAQHLPGAFEEV